MQHTLVEHSILHRLGRNIGEGTAAGIVQSPVRASKLLQVSAHSGLLPGRTGPQIGETTGGEVYGFLGRSVGSTTNRSHPGASSGELGREVGGVAAIVSRTRSANTRIAGGEDDRNTAAAELSKQVANRESVPFGDGLSAVSVIQL